MVANFSLTEIVIIFIRKFYQFVRLVYGCIQKPYATYRSLILFPSFWPLFFIGALIALYLVLSALAKNGLRTNPFFLSTSAIEAGLAISITFVLTGLLLYVIGRLVGGKGSLKGLYYLWAFSLLPTLSWFLISTVFYVLVPPPRTLSIRGIVFSYLFVAFSVGCFYWKGILYYLTLRAGMRIGAGKIILVSVIFLPLLMLYAFFSYRFGVFNVPFI